MGKLYAVYSKQQDEQVSIWRKSRCAVIWEKPDGTEVLCTGVSPKPGCPTNMWADKIDLGEVVKFIRSS